MKTMPTINRAIENDKLLTNRSNAMKVSDTIQKFGLLTDVFSSSENAKQVGQKMSSIAAGGIKTGNNMFWSDPHGSVGAGGLSRIFSSSKVENTGKVLESVGTISKYSGYANKALVAAEFSVEMIQGKPRDASGTAMSTYGSYVGGQLGLGLAGVIISLTGVGVVPGVCITAAAVFGGSFGGGKFGEDIGKKVYDYAAK